MGCRREHSPQVPRNPTQAPQKQSADVGRFLSHPPIRFDKGTCSQSSVRVSKAWSTLEDNIPGIPAFFNEDARLLRVRTDLKRKERRLMACWFELAFGFAQTNSEGLSCGCSVRWSADGSAGRYRARHSSHAATPETGQVKRHANHVTAGG